MSKGQAMQNAKAGGISKQKFSPQEKKNLEIKGPILCFGEKHYN